MYNGQLLRAFYIVLEIGLHVYWERVSLYDIYNSLSFFSRQIYHMVLHFDFSTGIYLTFVYVHVPICNNLI